MKKARTALITLMIVACCMPAFAASYTLEEKFVGQIGNAALTGEVTFSVTGEEAAAENSVYPQLGQVLPGTKISFALTASSKYPKGGWVKVNGADGSEKEVKFLYDDASFALGGTAIAEDGVYYRMDGHTLFLRDENQVPGIFELLEMMDNADEAWKEKAKERLAVYETMLSVWMNDYAGTAMGREKDVLYSELNCTIPVQAMKSQIKTMLKVFYTDAQTLDLLHEVLDGTGGEIYLNPAMESVFGALADSVQLTGDIQVVRRFDSRGQLMLDSVSLPLDGMEISLFPQVKWNGIRLDVTDNGFAFGLVGAGEENVQFSLEKQTEENCTGRIVTDLPAEDGKLQHKGYDFSWTWQKEEETYSLQQDQSERLMHGMLILTPDEKTEEAEQQISLEVRFTSKSGRGTPTHLEANLVWAAKEGDPSVTMQLKAKTANAFDVEDIRTLENTVAWDTLPKAERDAILLQVLLLPVNQAVALPE